jgi:hypothetical protein
MTGLLRRLCVILPLAIVQSAVYWGLNHYPLLRSRELPFTWLDVNIPFWTWTIWGYLALYMITPVLALAVQDRRVFNRLVVAYGVATTTAIAYFALWPTHYPRPPQPTDGSWHSIAYRWVTQLDTPECCFPSLHIIVPVIACAAFWQDRRRNGLWFALPLGVGIFTLTILTTKQHYVWDLVGGFATAAVGIVLSRRLVPDGKR